MMISSVIICLIVFFFLFAQKFLFSSATNLSPNKLNLEWKLKDFSCMLYIQTHKLIFIYHNFSDTAVGIEINQNFLNLCIFLPEKKPHLKVRLGFKPPIDKKNPFLKLAALTTGYTV